MNIITVHEPERQTFRVYVCLGDVQRKPGWRWFQKPNGGIEEIPPNGEPPMWIRLPEEIARQLAEHFSEPRPEATEHHLYDAIGVRDRLLTMVERMTYPPMPIQLGGSGE